MIWRRKEAPLDPYKLTSHDPNHKHIVYSVNKDEAILRIIKTMPPGTNLHAIRNYVAEKV